MTMSSLTFLATTKPAGGAALDQIIIANLMAGTASALLLWLVLGHRSGKRSHLARAAAYAERVSGMPGWASLPLAVAMSSLLVALLGMYWDISLHIDQGRDPGPLANPAHYFILAGLFGVLLAGGLGLAFPSQPTRTSIRLPPRVPAPIGALMIAICGASSLLAVPLRDI